MRDYFSGIVEKVGETGATRGDTPLNPRVSAASKTLNTVAPCNKLRGDGGDNGNMSPLVPPIPFEGETAETRESAAAAPVAPATPEIIDNSNKSNIPQSQKLLRSETQTIQPCPNFDHSIPNVRHADSSSLLRPFNEIKQAGLEEYYDYFQERAAIREFDGKQSKEEAEWQAMNDTIYKFMEDHHVDLGSIEVNRFIKQMLF